MRLQLKPGVDSYVLVEQTDDINAIIIKARPALTEVIEEAKLDPSILELGEEVRSLIENEDGTVNPDLMRVQGKVGLLFAKAIARAVIVEWEGLEDPDGKPAPVTADRVNALLDHRALYDAFTAKYLARWMTVESEKNGSAPSPSGTSAAARPTASRARRAAKSAPRKSTSRKR